MLAVDFIPLFSSGGEGWGEEAFASIIFLRWLLGPELIPFRHVARFSVGFYKDVLTRLASFSYLCPSVDYYLSKFAQAAQSFCADVPWPVQRFHHQPRKLSVFHELPRRLSRCNESTI